MEKPKPAMYHMLKSLGINPEEIEAVGKNLTVLVGDLSARLERIENKVDGLCALTIELNSKMEEKCQTNSSPFQSQSLSLIPPQTEMRKSNG